MQKTVERYNSLQNQKAVFILFIFFTFNNLFKDLISGDIKRYKYIFYLPNKITWRIFCILTNKKQLVREYKNVTDICCLFGSRKSRVGWETFLKSQQFFCVLVHERLQWTNIQQKLLKKRFVNQQMRIRHEIYSIRKMQIFLFDNILHVYWRDTQMTFWQIKTSIAFSMTFEQA